MVQADGHEGKVRGQLRQPAVAETPAEEQHNLRAVPTGQGHHVLPGSVLGETQGAHAYPGLALRPQVLPALVLAEGPQFQCVGGGVPGLQVRVLLVVPFRPQALDARRRRWTGSRC